MSRSFSVTKWYMDLVTDEGEAVLVCAADLRFGSLNLAYTNLVQYRAGHTRQVSSLRRAIPVLDQKKLSWTSSALGVRATWLAEGEPFRETLMSTESGAVDWNCVMPLARAEIQLDDGRVVSGLGYVEELTMTLPPWDLPIDELRWGRFVAEGASVVWLDWRGTFTKRLIFKHGVRVTGTVEDHSVEIPEDEARVVLQDESVIRQGPLGATALGVLAELHPMLPAKMLAINERNVCASATLEQPYVAPVRGWAVAQTAKWG